MYEINEDSPLFAVAKLLEEKDALIVASSNLASFAQSELTKTQAQLADMKTLVDTQTKQIADLKHELYVLKTPIWEQKADDIIATAMALYDRHKATNEFPYDFGGTPKLDIAGNVIGGSFDCSSFTDYCFTKNGYPLSRTSYNQAKQGTEVKTADIRKGDLLCLDVTSSRTTPGGIDHVQIYIGNGQIIHTNPSGNGINIRNLSDYTSKIVTVRRIIKELN